MNPPPPMEKAVFLGIVAFSAVAGVCGYLAWRSWRAKREVPPPTRPAGQVSGYTWFIILLMVVVITYLFSGKARNRPGPPDRPPAASYRVGLLIAVATFAAVLAIAIFGRDRLTPRVVKLLNDKKLDEAHALVLRALERRPPVEPVELPAAPRPAPSADADPWAPPRASLARADRRGANLLNLMGVVEANRGNWSEALGYYRRAERIAGVGPLIRSNVGLALTRLGRVEEGLAMVRDAIGEVPESSPADRSVFEALLADRLIDLGRLPEARACLESIDGRAGAIKGVAKWVKKSLLDQVAKTRAKLEAAEAAPPADPA